MRILVVTSMYPSGTSYTGCFIAEQVRSLRADGLEVDVLHINPRVTRLNYILRFPALVRALRSAHYDILHTHHTYSSLLVNFAKWLTKLNTPLILTNHEGEVLDSERRGRTWHPSSWLRYSIWLKKLAARSADFVIFVSGQTPRVLATNGHHAIIPCGVDLEKFRTMDRASCRAQLGLPLDIPVVFFPANPTARGKHFALAQKAFEVVRESTPSAVLLTGGSIPPESMPFYYNAADVVLQASFYEASPTIVKEALACEVPLVSTDSGDTLGIIQGVSNCFVCEDDPSKLADRILTCLGERAEGGRNRLRALGLDLDQTAHKIVAVYEKVRKGKLDDQP